MARERSVTVEQSVKITINNEDAIERITGPKGDEWRAHLYDIKTEDDILEHWAYNAIANDVTDARALDGWADLEPGEVTMEVEPVHHAYADPIPKEKAA